MSESDEMRGLEGDIARLEQIVTEDAKAIKELRATNQNLIRVVELQHESASTPAKRQEHFQELSQLIRELKSVTRKRGQ
jgi:hypothetical protein